MVRALKKRDGWTSVFSTAVPLSADLSRNITRFAGAHVYTASNDVFMADSSVDGFHSLRTGKKMINLPCKSDVIGLIRGQKVSQDTKTGPSPHAGVSC